MMNDLVERGYVFDFSGCVDAYKVDAHSYNGLSLVDFVVETSDKFLFIEVKNADSDMAKMHSEREDFLSSPSEFAAKICRKFRDTLLRELAKGKKFPRPITYILLLEFSKFDMQQRRKLLESMRSRIPEFSESEYTAVNSIGYVIHNFDEFQAEYNTFKITSRDMSAGKQHTQ